MNLNSDIRWRHRHDNFKKAMVQLRKIFSKKDLNEIELQGLVKCFEYSFELAWKMMKDYLESLGYLVNSPRSAIQTAFSAQVIDDGYLWIEALEKRNLMAHTYDEKIFEEVTSLIKEKYYEMLNVLDKKFDNLD